jgi:exonuclease VII large subunit
MLKDSHGHVKLMGRPNKKVATRATKDDPPAVEDQILEKDAPQDPNSSIASEAEEQRLKELEQVLRKQKELEECRTRVGEKSLKQRIEEPKATLRELNEQLQSASHEVINLEEPNSATKASQEKNSLKSFISIDPSSPLSINLQLAQWPLE